MIGQTMGGHTLGLLRIEIKHVNHKTCVHCDSELGSYPGQVMRCQGS